MPIGTVVSFARGKYGFVKPDDGGPDLFVHAKAVERSGLEYLSRGTRVRYQVMPDRDGRPTADDIVILGEGQTR